MTTTTSDERAVRLQPSGSAADASANSPAAPSGWIRRARPLLGTLVELGLAPGTANPAAVLAAGFQAVQAVQAALSRFDASSDIARFNALAAGRSLALRPASLRVLRAAQALQRVSGGDFDISLGSGASDWHLAAGRLHKTAPGVRLDTGGIAKGHALDAAVRALQQAGCRAGWVNAGGDLRVFGGVALPLHLRDEQRGGTRAIGSLADGAFATSGFGPGCRSLLHAVQPRRRHAWSGAAPPAVRVSVAAPRGLWADALTKIVGASGDPQHPLLARLGACAWLH
jgi:thiamine biosynthesis lipoprotein